MELGESTAATLPSDLESGGQEPPAERVTKQKRRAQLLHSKITASVKSEHICVLQTYSREIRVECVEVEDRGKAREETKVELQPFCAVINCRDTLGV